MGKRRLVPCIIAVFFTACAVFVFSSLFSHSSHDNPFADYPPNDPVQNVCGIAGAFVSGYVLAWFGKTSFLIGVVFSWLGLLYFCRDKVESLWVKALGGVLLLFSVASLLTLGCYAFRKSMLSHNVGGVVGVVLASRLFENFNYTGATIILALGLVVSLMLLFNVTPVSPFLKEPKESEESEESEEPESVDPHKSVSKATKAVPMQAVKVLEAPESGDSHKPDVKDTKAIPIPIPGTNILTRQRDNPKGILCPDDKDGKKETEPRSFWEKIKVPANKPVVVQAVEEDAALHAKKAIESKDRPYTLPPHELLEEPPQKQGEDDWSQITLRAQTLKTTLEQFNVQCEVMEIQKGPVITMYELELAPGTKVGKVVSLSDDLAIALKSPSVRIVAPLLGKSSIGVEVPNVKREVVVLRELLESADEIRKKMSIPLLVGKDVAGNPVFSDLAAMPHLLIAGTTGSGKSVCLNSVILSILFMRYPSEVQLLLVDPKMVEFSLFKEIPHLISPVVTDMKKAAAVLEWAVNKMEERYALLASVGVKHINGYNKLGASEIKKRLNPEGDVDIDDVPFYLPHIVIVVDELADLMMVASNEVEGSVIRLSQKSRAVGIHLILATQRPSVDVITGLIKSNLPSRISFYVASKVDSRTILDQNGAEKLLGGGDMLFLPPGTSKLVRVQGAYVSDDEVRNVVEYLRKCAVPQFSPELKQWKGAVDKENDARDNLYQEAVRIVLESQRGSVSLLQRRLEIGYSRAAKLIDLMAENGIVGEYKGSQAREVFLTLEDWEAQMSRMRPDESDNA